MEPTNDGPTSSRRARALDLELDELTGELKKTRRRNALLVLGVLALVGAAIGGAFLVHRSRVEQRRKARNDAFAAVETCMIGGRLVHEESLSDRLRQVRLGRHEVASTEPDGWPGRCAPAIEAASTAQKSYAPEGTELDNQLTCLKDAVERPDVALELDTLLERIRLVWDAAEKEGVAGGVAASAPASPTLAVAALEPAALAHAKDLEVSSRIDLARGRLPTLDAGPAAIAFAARGVTLEDEPRVVLCAFDRARPAACEERRAPPRASGLALARASNGDVLLRVSRPRGRDLYLSRKGDPLEACTGDCLAADLSNGQVYTLSDRGDGSLYTARVGPSGASPATLFFAPGKRGEKRPPEPLSSEPAHSEKDPKKVEEKEAKEKGEPVETGRAFTRGGAVIGSHAFVVSYSDREGEPPERELADVDLDAPDRVVSLGAFTAPGEIVGSATCRAPTVTYLVLEVGVIGSTLKRFVARRSGSDPFSFAPIDGSPERFGCDDERLWYHEAQTLSVCAFGGRGPACRHYELAGDRACFDGTTVHVLSSDTGAVEWTSGEIDRSGRGDPTMKTKLLIDLQGRDVMDAFDVVCAGDTAYALIGGFGRGTKLAVLGHDGTASALP